MRRTHITVDGKVLPIRPVLPNVLTEAEIAERADAFAKRAGFSCIEAYQRAGHSAVLPLGNGRVRRFAALRDDTPAAPEAAPAPKLSPAAALGVTATEVKS